MVRATVQHVLRSVHPVPTLRAQKPNDKERAFVVLSLDNEPGA